MRNSVHIATIGDIDIGIHFSWFLVFFLVAWTLAVGLFPAQLPGLGDPTYWAMGIAASILLFVSVLIHELAHSFVAKALGLRVKGIILFVFGGVSNISGEPASARDELLIAIVGPLTSLALAGAFWGISRGVGGGDMPVDAVVAYLVLINLLLAVFNLVPGFPLDGGRVLRAAVWWVTNSLETATRVAVWSGHIVGFLFIFGGLYIAFSGALLSGFWMVLIGWFINNAAEASGREREEMERFQGVAVRDVMNPRPLSVEPGIALSEVAHDYVLQRAVRTLPVVEGGWLLGMITLNEIRAVPRDRWAETPVRAVMIGAQDLRKVKPEDGLGGALQLMAANDVNQLPVVENGHLVGMLSRDNVIGFLQIREDAGRPGLDEDRRRAA